MKNWYKNVIPYEINEDISFNQEDLNSKLEEKKLIPCGKNELFSQGWEPLLIDDETSYALKASGAFLMCLTSQEKDIPSSVVKEELEKRVHELEKKEDRKAKGSEKKDIKDNIIAEMRPNAFIKTKRTYGYLDIKNKKLIINTSSGKTADNFTSFLRQTIDKLPISIFGENSTISGILTSYLQEQKNMDKFIFGSKCILKEINEDGSTITAKKQNLFTDEIKEHLDSGKYIDEVELIWQERISFSIDSKMKLKSMKPLDIVQETIEEDLGESVDAYAMMSATYNIMVEDINEILNDLINIK